MKPVILTAAICGAEVTKEISPFLPVSAEELAREALDCEKAGAAVIHLHVRDSRGRPTQDVETFHRAIEAMKKAGVTAIIQPTTGGAVTDTPDQRIQPVKLNPEMASLDCGTVNFGDGYFVNHLPMMRQFAREMKERGIVPELECFDAGHISNARKLRDEGLLSGHLHFNLVMGVPGAIAATADNLLHMVRLLPAGSTWTVSGIGRNQLSMNLIGLAAGGHIRVGMEDNIYLSRGILSEGNAPFVARMAGYAGDLGRPVASPDEARAILLSKKETL